MPPERLSRGCQTCVNGSGWLLVPPDGIDLCDVHPAIVPYITTLVPCPACGPPPPPTPRSERMDIDIMQAQLQQLMKYLPMLEEIAEERNFEVQHLEGQPSQPPGPDAPNLADAVGAGVRRDETHPELTRPR